MKISFVIPAHNEEELLPACLASVFAEIERTLTPLGIARSEIEVVVVNNASTDKTKEVAQSFAGVRVVDEPRKGLVWARAAGFEATEGELSANIDADTELPEGWLATVLNEFGKNPRLVALSGPYVYRDISLLDRALVAIFYFFGYLVYLLSHYCLGGGGMLQGGNFVLRRHALRAVGGFDTSIAFYGEDTDIARRLAPLGKVKFTWFLPMYTSGRRLKQGGLFKTGFIYALNFFWILLSGRPATREYKDIR